MKLAIKGAQNNGELFTAPSLVQMSMNVIKPDHRKKTTGCGTFYRQQKTAITIRLAKMNPAVHEL
jgi:type I restriction enzyme M protein